MALMPPYDVPAPQPRGLRYGLFTAANGPLALPDHGRGGGVQYVPETCGHAHVYPVDCPDDSPAELKVFDPGSDTVVLEPFVVYGSLNCGSAGVSQEDLVRRVTSNLLSGEQTQAEAALADELAAGSAGLGTATDIVDAVSRLEQWLYGATGADYGYVGYIHASPDVAAYAGEAYLIEDQGPVKRTPLNTIWSIGGGYPEGTLFISGQVTVWRSQNILIPPLDQVFDRETNQYNILAEREYVVGYDCFANSIELDLGGSP